MQLLAAEALQADHDGLDPLVKLVAEKLGRSFFYKNDPKKPKDGVFVSHVHGRTVYDDPDTTIYIYRIHYGHYGNLHRLRSKKSPLYKGCSDIARHVPELTAYLYDARLDSTNNRA